MAGLLNVVRRSMSTLGRRVRTRSRLQTAMRRSLFSPVMRRAVKSIRNPAERLRAETHALQLTGGRFATHRYRRAQRIKGMRR